LGCGRMTLCRRRRRDTRRLTRGHGPIGYCDIATLILRQDETCAVDEDILSLCNCDIRLVEREVGYNAGTSAARPIIVADPVVSIRLSAGEVALQAAAVWPRASKRNCNVVVTVAKFVGPVCCRHVCGGVQLLERKASDAQDDMLRLKKLKSEPPAFLRHPTGTAAYFIIIETRQPAAPIDLFSCRSRLRYKYDLSRTCRVSELAQMACQWKTFRVPTKRLRNVAPRGGVQHHNEG
jgi:hypothetical protein